MKRIKLKKTETGFDYKKQLEEIVKSPTINERTGEVMGLTFDEMEQIEKVLTPIRAAKGSVDIEDADYDFIVRKMKGVRIMGYSEESLEFSRDILKAEEVKK